MLLLAVVAQALLAAGLLWWARHNCLPPDVNRHDNPWRVLKLPE